MTPAPAVVVEPSRHGGWLVRTCPFCGKPHDHGAAALGSRVSHCADPAVRGTYELRPASRRTFTTKKRN